MAPRRSSPTPWAGLPIAMDPSAVNIRLVEIPASELSKVLAKCRERRVNPHSSASCYDPGFVGARHTERGERQSWIYRYNPDQPPPFHAGTGSA